MTARLMVAIDAAADLAQQGDGRIRRRVLYPLYVLRVGLQVVRQWARDRCPQAASSLAFQTTLSLVPLVATALAILRATGAFAEESSLVEFLSRQVLPISRKEIAERVVEFAGNLSSRTAGGAGFITTLVLSFILYTSVEKIFNDIWRVDRRRSYGQQFVVFYAMMTIVPTLMGLSLYRAARYGLTTGVLGAAGALAASWAGFFFANKFLPACRVSWRAALAGSFTSALLFEMAKHLFQLYVVKVAFESYAGIYGALGLVPIFLAWVYYIWLVILFGAEVAHAVQNLDLLERLDRRRHHISAEEELVAQTNGLVAARLLGAIIESWRRAERGITKERLAARFDLSEDVVERVLRRLKEAHLVLEVEGDAEGYLPARPPAEITLADVLSPFGGPGFGGAAGASAGGPADGLGRTPLDEALAELEADLRDRSRKLTFDRV